MQQEQSKCAECGATVRGGADAVETPLAAALLSNSFDVPPMCVKCANYNLKAA